MSLLKVEDIRFSVDKATILERVSMDLQSGEMVGLIGPNGAGKSTLLKIMSGVIEASYGNITYQGVSLEQIPHSRKASEIAYLAQGARAYWPLPVRNVVELGRLPFQKWWKSLTAHDHEIINRSLQKAGIEHLAQRTVTTLSGGEQTLVMLARIFATQPQLILADEPVAALDPYHQLHVMDLLKAFVSGQQQSVIVVLHDLGLAARYCDRIYLMHHGKIHAHGSPAEVLTPANIEAVYGVRCAINCHAETVSIVPVERINKR